MPHAVEMPSFLSDDTGPMLSNRPPFDLPSHLRQSYEKLNGTARTSSHTSIKSSLVDAIDSHTAGARAQVNGDMLLDTNLSSVPNGRSSGSTYDHKSSRNGSTLSVNGVVNGVTEIGRKSPAPRNGTPRLSNGDRGSQVLTNGIVDSPVEIEPAPTTNGDSEPPKQISIPAPISTNPQSTGPLTYNSSLLPATPSANETHTPKSSHRFSSPPAYPPAINPSPSTHSLPHPGAATLKHRHTLQVPKVGQSRNSRDDDALYTSGRFSPTHVRRGSFSLGRRNTQSIHSNMPHEDVPLDEDAMRWAEAVRQKRASKRKRKDEEDDDRVVVGTKVDQNHVNWVTAYNMLTGIRFTVSRTNAKIDRALTDMDFDAKNKFSFDM